jgi:hypothetical protein
MVENKEQTDRRHRKDEIDKKRPIGQTRSIGRILISLPERDTRGKEKRRESGKTRRDKANKLKKDTSHSLDGRAKAENAEEDDKRTKTRRRKAAAITAPAHE